MLNGIRVVIDIECNALHNPDKIWVIVAKDIDTGEYHIFRRVSDELQVAERARAFIQGCTEIIGHNVLGYDAVVLGSLLNLDYPSLALRCTDTLILSKLTNYSRKGHSIEDFGLEYGLPKGNFSDWGSYSEAMEEYCIRDVDICERVYRSFSSVLDDPSQRLAIETEHRFQLVVNDLSLNGFGFDSKHASSLLAKVERELAKLDEAIHVSFPRRLKPVREVHPVYTKYGTLNRKDFRFVGAGDLTEYNGGSFTRCRWEDFNPASHRQIINVLHSAGWKPVERTATAIKNARSQQSPIDTSVENKYSWKINETNLATLPPTAPPSAKSLARRILVESRRRTLTEWLSLVATDERIHGKFYAIGAWTHRMAHQAPNTANIPNDKDLNNKTRYLGAEMRSLWQAPPGRLLVGVDAEGIQLRIFAHYIDDPEFTKSIVEGNKSDKTDPHSLNQRIMGRVCRSRQTAKRFIYALLLGAGIGKLSQILECEPDQTKLALDRLLERYSGWAKLRREVIPIDAERGFFFGLDGRKVKIFGDTESERRHLAMSGYLQNGEAVAMKHATLRWYDVLQYRKIEFKLVNFVHDEWQTECEGYNNAIIIANTQCDSLRWVGEKFGLRCPLAGSYMNEGEYMIGTNWKVTH